GGAHQGPKLQPNAPDYMTNPPESSSAAKSCNSSRRNLTIASGSLLLIILAVAAIDQNTKGGLIWKRRDQTQNYFETSFQDESQFIVETIVTDLAEMAYFAKNHV